MLGPVLGSPYFGKLPYKGKIQRQLRGMIVLDVMHDDLGHSCSEVFDVAAANGHRYIKPYSRSM